MALTKNWKKSITGFGELSLNNGYCKITNINGSKELIKFTLVVKNKDTNEAFDAFNYKFVPTLDDKNFIAQAYDYLKTLPEFINAVDC